MSDVQFVKILPAYREEEDGLLIFHIPPPGSQVWHEGKIYKVIEAHETILSPVMPYDEFKVQVEFTARLWE